MGVTAFPVIPPPVSSPAPGPQPIYCILQPTVSKDRCLVVYPCLNCFSSSARRCFQAAITLNSLLVRLFSPRFSFFPLFPPFPSHRPCLSSSFSSCFSLFTFPFFSSFFPSPLFFLRGRFPTFCFPPLGYFSPSLFLHNDSPFFPF